MRRSSLVLTLWLSACATPREGTRPATPYDAATAGAMAANELAHGAPDEVVFGWHVEVIGDRAKYFACAAADACTHRLVEIPAKSLVATKVVGQTRPSLDDGTSGAEVDVLRLTLAREGGTTRGGASTDARGLVVR